MKHLLIGGQKDGRFIEVVDEDKPFVIIPDELSCRVSAAPLLETEQRFSYTTYIQHKIYTNNGGVILIYATENLTADDIMRKLVANYRGGAANDND